MSWIKISGLISPDTARDVLMSRQKYVFCVASNMPYEVPASN